MVILGIDTSCDDSCVAILGIKNSGFKILSNIVSSQTKLHAKYGGVYPFLAKREHQKNLPIVLKRALKKAKLSLKKIDLIGVTVGPGLEPCLWQGINFAQKLAQKFKKPLFAANHIEAHILVNLKSQISNLKSLFPAVCLVVSGGHTVLFLMEEIGKYKFIGETRDDAAGECLDKVARLLDLGYPGGPVIEKLAKEKLEIRKDGIKLPRPMINQKNYDFSFAGLKTAVLYDFRSRPEKKRKSKEYKIEMAKEVQQAVIDVLEIKTFRAAKEFGAKAIFLGGGVAANEKLREIFSKRAEKEKLKIFIPEKIFCTDNGVMIAVTTYFRQKEATRDWQKTEAKADLEI